MTVSRQQRFTRGHPCPICGGGDHLRRGEGVRCSGFLSSDGLYARCSREDFAGALPNENDLYVHRLAGMCRCGVSHGPPDASSKTPSRAIVARYPYQDEEGNLLFEAVRYSPKGFSQRRPDGNGGWTWNLDGVKRVPYRLPEVLAAVKSGIPIVVVEGEKDADRLRSEGLVATCNPGGAGRWQDEYSGYFAGAQVVVIPDNDQQGREHADHVAKSLQRAGALVKVVPLPGLPEKGDVSDFFASGRGVKELADILKGAPVVRPQGLVLVRASKVKPRETDWLFPGIPFGSLTILAGNPGDGKTTIAVSWCAAASRSGIVSIFATAEDSISTTLKPRLDAAGADSERILFVHVNTEEGYERGIVLPDDIPDLESRVSEFGARLLVVDPLAAHLGGDINSHRDQDVRRALAPLARLAEATGCAVVVIAHLNKSAETTVFGRVGGSIGITAAARSIFVTGGDPEDPEGVSRVLVHAKCNLAPLESPQRYAIEGRDTEGIQTSAIRWLGDATGISVASILGRDSDEERGQLAEAKTFLAVELAEGPVATKELFKRASDVGLSEKTLRRAKSALGVEARKEGLTGPWFWKMPNGPDEATKMANDDAKLPLSQNLGHLQDDLAIFGSDQHLHKDGFGHLQDVAIFEDAEGGQLSEIDHLPPEIELEAHKREAERLLQGGAA